MEKQIFAIRRKMIFTIGLLIALSVWQHEFIVKGVMAHVQINVTILGTGAFGVYSAFIFVARLGNEVIAFRALKEMSDDIRRMRGRAGDDLARIYARCSKPAHVFQRPKLLGHAYDLVTEELARTKNVRISVETMNTLVHKIESSINDEKSLIVYISGLLVFMGLIGTFIGLLHMVSAIGGIIGSLAKSGDAGSGAFSELLGALEEPLKGMASGFASSLFGLFCSLLVGLMGRFAGQAAGVLKANFEAWLAGVVQLSDAEIAAETATDGHVEVLQGAPPPDSAMLKLVGGVLNDYSRVAATFADAAKSLKDIRADQGVQSEALARLAEVVVETRTAQTRTLEALAAQAPLNQTVEALGTKLQDALERMSRQREQEAKQVAESLNAITRQHNQELRLFTQRQVESSTQIVTALTALSVTMEQISQASRPEGLEIAIERAVGRAQSESAEDITVALAAIVQAIDRAFADGRIEDQARSEALLSALRQPERGVESATLGALESALETGLTRVAQSVESALGAYSSLARVALATLERTQPGGVKAQADAPTGRDASHVA